MPEYLREAIRNFRNDCFRTRGRTRESGLKVHTFGDPDDLARLVDEHCNVNSLADHHTPYEDAVLRDAWKILETAIEALPRQRRRVFRLRVLEDLPVATVALRLRMSKSTVTNHLSRALQDLRGALRLAGIHTSSSQELRDDKK